MEKFCDTTKVGDVIGLLLEFDPDNGQGQITFFINGASVGKAFENIKEGEYYPCLSLNYGSNIVTLNSSARMPTEPYRMHGEDRGGGGGGGGSDEDEEEGME